MNEITNEQTLSFELHRLAVNLVTDSNHDHFFKIVLITVCLWQQNLNQL